MSHFLWGIADGPRVGLYWSQHIPYESENETFSANVMAQFDPPWNFPSLKPSATVLS